ncbi:MAG: tRNA (N6-threonylcarbamoyladenosine(37)-N6)-methyltransferase TrmO, partial [Candidatus Lokiarchaeota archaeon]|nr:tRNA (N6-threonylcarbamoyladenosine(37)-N6)-methyltransferase TrmO [Candidatus Lokiarchaeota archaeon]
PIGFISSCYKNPSDVPRQAIYAKKEEAYIQVKKRYQLGLKDLDQFSHALIIFYFHQSTREDIQATPFLDSQERGIFAIRSPHRPNHIGCSVVSIKRIVGDKLYFTGVDMIDSTPVLDIKPFIPSIDDVESVSLGWLAQLSCNSLNSRNL